MQIRSEHDPEIQKIWEEVNQVAPTDALAMEIFYEFSEVYGRNNCGHEKVKRQTGDRKTICTECGVIWWFTSGTLLHRAKRFKAYLFAMLVREAGWLISAFSFSRLTGVIYGTAYNIERKLNVAMANQMSLDAAETTARPFAAIIARRSRETPARMHPFAEQEEIEKLTEEFSSECVQDGVEEGEESECESAGNSECPDADSVDATSGKPESEFEAAIRKVSHVLTKEGISAEKISVVTGISIGLTNSALTMLEINGKTKELPGGKFISLIQSKVQTALTEEQLALAAWVDRATLIIIQIIDEFFRRVSRKDLQLYFAAIWCALDRERWGKNSVMQLCFTHPPVFYKAMVAYVSPHRLKIMLPE